MTVKLGNGYCSVSVPGGKAGTDGRGYAFHSMIPLPAVQTGLVRFGWGRVGVWRAGLKKKTNRKLAFNYILIIDWVCRTEARECLG